MIQRCTSVVALFNWSPVSDPRMYKLIQNYRHTSQIENHRQLHLNLQADEDDIHGHCLLANHWLWRNAIETMDDGYCYYHFRSCLLLGSSSALFRGWCIDVQFWFVKVCHVLVDSHSIRYLCWRQTFTIDTGVEGLINYNEQHQFKMSNLIELQGHF